MKSERGGGTFCKFHRHFPFPIPTHGTGILSGYPLVELTSRLMAATATAAAAAVAVITKQLLQPNQNATRAGIPRAPRRRSAIARAEFPAGTARYSKSRQTPTSAPAASSAGGDVSATYDAAEDAGVLLGTLKLPQNTDLNLFETLLFQWANSLCQGANVPLPVPLKVDRVRGGARLGFIETGDGEAETPVYIDCLVFPASGGAGPIFRAVRNGPKKEQVPPGEPRIMRSLLQALQKSTEIAAGTA